MSRGWPQPARLVEGGTGNKAAVGVFSEERGVGRRAGRRGSWAARNEEEEGRAGPGVEQGGHTSWCFSVLVCKTSVVNAMSPNTWGQCGDSSDSVWSQLPNTGDLSCSSVLWLHLQR